MTGYTDISPDTDEWHSFHTSLDEHSLLLSLPVLNCNVVRTEQNRYGEVFVLIKAVSKSGSKLDVNYSYKSYVEMDENRTGNTEESYLTDTTRIRYTISVNNDFQIKSVSSNYGKGKSKNGHGTYSKSEYRMVAESIDYKTDKSEYFASGDTVIDNDGQRHGSDIKYRYNSYMQYIKKDKYGDIILSFDDPWSQELNNSLGVAYLDALFKLLTNARDWTKNNTDTRTERNATRLKAVSIMDGMLLIQREDKADKRDK
jgi:hypothetical protein